MSFRFEFKSETNFCGKNNRICYKIDVNPIKTLHKIWANEDKKYTVVFRAKF